MKCSFLPDNVRVAVAYYIGTDKEYNSLPLATVGLVSGASLALSEIIAKARKRKINPLQPTNTQGSQGKNMVISNLIPFTRLNMIISFCVLVLATIKFFKLTEIGMPTISIYCSLELLLIMLTNPAARKHFRRKLAGWRGVDFVEDLEQQQQEQVGDRSPGDLQNSRGP